VASPPLDSLQALHANLIRRIVLLNRGQKLIDKFEHDDRGSQLRSNQLYEFTISRILLQKGG